MFAQLSGDYGQRTMSMESNRIAPMSTPLNGADDRSNGSSASITANDFLTLLVTEMKNQDPTANSDPNEYINQLVQVNSLQQLISINETLTTAIGGDSSQSAAPRSEIEAPCNSSLNRPASLHSVHGNLSMSSEAGGALPVAFSLSSRHRA